MSLDELRDAGVLLPEKEWGEHRLSTTVPRLPFLTAFLAAAAGCVLAYLADGGPLTWVGILLFLAALLTVTSICNRAVGTQRRRVRREAGARRQQSAAR